MAGLPVINKQLDPRLQLTLLCDSMRTLLLSIVYSPHSRHQKHMHHCISPCISLAACSAESPPKCVRPCCWGLTAGKALGRLNIWCSMETLVMAANEPGLYLRMPKGRFLTNWFSLNRNIRMETHGLNVSIERKPPQKKEKLYPSHHLQKFCCV